MSDSRNSIIWLHLSDLHLCEERTGWDAHRVLKPLIHDLRKMEHDHGLRPQMLFFTGDAAFGNIGAAAGSTLKDQFDGSHEFLDGIRAAFSTAIAKENTFVVPGNHDIDRAEVGADQTAWLTAQRSSEQVDDLIHKAGIQWRRYMERLKTCQDALVRHEYDHLAGDPKRMIFSQSRSVHGLTVGIAGFNSAWSCHGDGEKGKLWCGGNWQAGELIRQLGHCDLRIALTHHPFGWFNPAEDTQLRIQIERDFSFHLHGHEHLGWVDAKADGHVRIAAAACYDRSHSENGYNFVRLDLETGEGEVWLRRYDLQGGGWVPRVVAGRTNNDGLWRLERLTRLALLVPASPVAPSVGLPDPDRPPLVSHNPAPISIGSAIQRIFACEYREFRGRTRALEDLDHNLLRDPKRTGVVIGAIGGMGKTALANHFLTNCGIEQYFDVVLGESAKQRRLDFSAFDSEDRDLPSANAEIRTLRDYLVEVARQLAVRDPDALADDKLADEIRVALEGKRALLLLDNLETLSETRMAVDLLRQLCSPPDRKFLITSRELPSEPIQGVFPLPLRRLEDGADYQLVHDLLLELDRELAESAGRTNPAITEILKLADGHPLALRILTGKFSAQGEKAILAMRIPSQPQARREGDWNKELFRFVFDDKLIEHLGPVGLNVARFIASYPQGVAEEEVAAVCAEIDPAMTPAIFAEARRRLFRTFCVHREHVDGVAVLAMHALTREYFNRLSTERGIGS